MIIYIKFFKYDIRITRNKKGEIIENLQNTWRIIKSDIHLSIKVIYIYRYKYLQFKYYIIKT